MDTSTRIYKPQEAAKILSITPSYLSQLAREGKIDASDHTPQGHRRYNGDDIAKAKLYLAGHRTSKEKAEVIGLGLCGPRAVNLWHHLHSKIHARALLHSRSEFFDKEFRRVSSVDQAKLMAANKQILDGIHDDLSMFRFPSSKRSIETRALVSAMARLPLERRAFQLFQKSPLFSDAKLYRDLRNELKMRSQLQQRMLYLLTRSCGWLWTLQQKIGN